MNGQDTIERQKAELDSVLTSEAFRRAPNLTRLLNFICQKHWEGKGSEIKEYTLAVEVLGRPADFDPLTDSIVRVELHRLREKLKRYYQDLDQQHEFRIQLRSGTYVPEFLPTQTPGDNGGAAQALAGPVADSPENPGAALVPREFGLPAPLPPAATRRPRRLSRGYSSLQLWAAVGSSCFHCGGGRQFVPPAPISSNVARLLHLRLGPPQLMAEKYASWRGMPRGMTTSTD